MKIFATKQLSKKEMNAVKGGMGIADCVGMKYNVEFQYTDENGITRRSYGCGNTRDEAMNSGFNSMAPGSYKDFSYTWF